MLQGHTGVRSISEMKSTDSLIGVPVPISGANAYKDFQKEQNAKKINLNKNLTTEAINKVYIDNSMAQ